MMYCPKCGMKNEEDSSFCAKCGEKLETSPSGRSGRSIDSFFASCQKFWERVKKKIQSLTKKQKTIVISVLTLVVFVIGFLLVGNHFSSPEYLAIRYLESVVRLDYETYYDMMDFPKSEFISKDLFVSGMKKDHKEAIELDYYKVISPGDIKTGTILDSFGFRFQDFIINDENHETVIIEYRQKGSSKVEYMPITFQKTSGTRFLFFPKWKISGEDYLVSNYEIYALKGSTVTFHGIPLTEDYLEKNNQKENFDFYKLPKVLAVKTDLMMKIQDKITIEEEVVPSKVAYVPEDVSLSDETYQAFLKEVESSLTELMSAATTKKGYEELVKDERWSHYEDRYYTLEKIYNNIVAGSTSSLYTYENIKVTGVDAENKFSINEDGYFELSVDMKYAYTKSYTSYTGEVKSQNLVDTYTVKVSFEMDQGNLFIHSFQKTFAYLF